MTTQTGQATRTPEQRRALAEALHASIIDQVQQLADSGRWRQFLDFARSFHTYSLNNLLLILAQKPDATMVAGYRQWQTKGRHVRTGETGIRIFGYSQKKASITEEGTTDENAERVVRFFPVLSVFDISQTDAIDGATPTPENPAQLLTGNNDHNLIGSLTAHLTTTGWTLTRKPLTHANGYTDPERRSIVLRNDLAPEQEAKTLLHETAHIQLHHIDDLDQYRAHRGRMEVEAESVAYIVAGLAGLETSTYSIGYITQWAGEDLDLIRDTATRVLKATHAIADILPQ
ncbi:ArdC-like ssDNA-binding domain-containing protein [Leifsonia sp. fls2-241-R2A-40a]|uniref:ArdC-like ssDNA-binding domain-containing protein n=1 Tax=Leifsonia sp. fls2-241-R2A-40a TaxID=3040290 RepID=UPI00254A4A0B|nr:ArdC-like ssDNA-binding domain-containing protein [Leifsonia sp. fls2-241-R2A-40a]